MKPATRRNLQKLLCVVGAVVIGSCLAEVGLRIGGLGMPSLYTSDQHCGSRLRPSTNGVWIFEGHGKIAINSRGFRGPEIPMPKAHNVFRIAVLGDSFIEALQVNEADSFCFQLQQILNNTASTSHKYEIINCGVSGYGTAQELLMLQNYVLPIDPDAVLLAIYPGNDIRNNLQDLEKDTARPYFKLGADSNLTADTSFRRSTAYQRAASNYEQSKAAIVNKSRVLQLAKHVRQHGMNGKLQIVETDIKDSLLQELVAAPYVYSQTAIPTHVEAWDVTTMLIQKFARTCEDSEIDLLTFNVSTPAQVYPDSTIRQQLQKELNLADLFYSEHRLSDFCEQNAINFFPLASCLESEIEGPAHFLHGFSNTRLGTGHWNKQGHQIAARLIAPTIIEMIDNKK